MGDHLFELVVGLMLIVLGLVSITRKRLEFHLGRSGWGKPLITLTASRAVAFGAVSLIGAAITLIPLIHVYANNDVESSKNGTLTLTTAAGIILVIISFVIAAFFEFLQSLRDRSEHRHD